MTPSVDDATAASQLFERLDGQPMSRVKRMFADTKYHNFMLDEWVGNNVARTLEIVKRPKDAEGCNVLGSVH